MSDGRSMHYCLLKDVVALSSRWEMSPGGQHRDDCTHFIV